LSRILFKISNFLTTIINFLEQARKKSHASWITPIYSDFFKNRKKNLKIICSESVDSSSKIRVHSPLWCQSKFFQILIIPHREKSKDSALWERTNPFKTNLHTRRWNRTKSHNLHQKQKFSKQHSSGNGVYLKKVSIVVWICQNTPFYAAIKKSQLSYEIFKDSFLCSDKNTKTAVRNPFLSERKL
jgi:hypothetical protein